MGALCEEVRSILVYNSGIAYRFRRSPPPRSRGGRALPNPPTGWQDAGTGDDWADAQRFNQFLAGPVP